MLNRLECPFEVKSVDDAGNFEGYASVFNNVDLGADIIEPGAFTSVKTTRNGRLKLALFHDLTKLIGSAEYSQDNHGLYLKGRINLNVSYARDAYELMKDGTLDSMSIGFNTLHATYEDRDGQEIRIIKQAELWEASIVPFGMNPKAQITNVKSSAGHFQQALQDRMGLSQKEAAAVASLGYSALQPEDVVGELKDFAQTLGQLFG